MLQTLISKRLSEVPASPIRKLVPHAVDAKKKGVKVYHLNIGDPDIKTPPAMIRVLNKWSQNPICYSQSQGESDLLTALTFYYHKLGYKFIQPQHIQVTFGGSEAISMTLFGICEAGDEVIVFEPFYTNYNSYAAVNQVKLVPVLTKGNNSFHLPSENEIEKKITKRTKAILICNPNNPTGTVYTKAEMDLLFKIAKKHDLFLVCDEVYREFVYGEEKHVSILSYMQQLPEKTILLDSLSKRYSLCGARLGVAISLNKDLIAGFLRIAQGRLSVGLVDQLMAAKMTEVRRPYFTKVIKEYKKRRDVLFDGLKKINGVFLEKPEGAFYAIVKLPVKDSEDFCRWLLSDFRYKNETVMIAPAAGFYATPGLGRNEVRIAYVLNVNDLKRSVTILQKALIEYNNS